MPDAIAAEARPSPLPAEDREPVMRWHLLRQLESAAIGERASDGSIAVRRSEPAGCILFGPYLHLAAGRYRFNFCCQSGRPRWPAQPVLGIEIIVLARFQQKWRDFTAAELAGGGGALEFEVTAEHSLEGENEGRFEFRFFHLGNADLVITAAEVERLPDDALPAPQPYLWRLLGRLQKTWLGRRTGDGGVAVQRIAPSGCLLFGGWPYLRLPGGHYRLTLRGRAGRPTQPGRPVLGVEVFGNSRWHSRRPLMQLLRRPETNGSAEAARQITAAEINAGPVELDFAVPTEMGLESGADAPFDIRLRHLANAALTVASVDLVKLDDEKAPAAPPSLVLATPRLRPPGRRKIVIIGNCQSETLRQGFAHIESLNRLFEVKYHFVQLPPNLHEFAARDLETCDILLIQDIRLWDDFVLRDRVRPEVAAYRFPLVRFASLWPFDAWNGPGDRQAHESEAPNLTFSYLDGLLGRLRKEIPDKEARFAAYRSLEVPGVVNYRRLHEVETRRLANMDKKFDFAIGSFILENFRARRLFHTTVRPNWEVFNLLLQFVAKTVGVKEPIALTASIDASLRNPQVPIHPKVARDLGVRWVDARTRYLDRGREITWESYIRSYIDHYG